MDSFTKKILKAVIIYVILIVIFFVLFQTVFMLSFIPSSSMENTIMTGEPGITYIKRVVGLPGETIEVKEGKVYADGVELDDSFIKAAMNQTGDGTYVVPEHCYFFIGDNRNNSKDSRFWDNPYVPADDIQAKAKCILFPFADICSLSYN